MNKILLGLILFSTHSFAYLFTGNWSGVCNTNGEIKETSRSIQATRNQISINGQRFNLGKTTSRHEQGVFDGKNWEEHTVYDWAWNHEEDHYINTNARWLGYYNDHSGAWTGRGTGYLRIVDGILETQRNFTYEFNGIERYVEENCSFEKL